MLYSMWADDIQARRFLHRLLIAWGTLSALITERGHALWTVGSFMHLSQFNKGEGATEFCAPLDYYSVVSINLHIEFPCSYYWLLKWHYKILLLLLQLTRVTLKGYVTCYWVCYFCAVACKQGEGGREKTEDFFNLTVKEYFLNFLNIQDLLS